MNHQQSTSIAGKEHPENRWGEVDFERSEKPGEGEPTDPSAARAKELLEQPRCVRLADAGVALRPMMAGW
jgi:cell division protein FtsN